MKSNEYLIVHKSILPEYFEQVIQARELINDKNFSVSDACKQLNISRSTYYKYKDYYDDPLYRDEYYFGSQLFVSPIVKKKDYVMNRVIHKFETLSVII